MMPMKIMHFNTGGTVWHGVLEVNNLIPLHDSGSDENGIFSDLNLVRKQSYKLQEVEVLPPVWPSKIIAVGINYRDHAEEFGHDIPSEPVIFMKPATSVIGHGDDIIYPPSAGRVDYEAEIAAVVKKRARNVAEKDAPDFILGYTCLNDVTARDLQRKDGQWTRAKSFDTFCPIGPCIETDIDPNNLRVQSRLNGETRQDSNTKHFIFPMFRLFSFISHVMTLLPGDIITTGTPSGVGAMTPGDVVEIEVEGIGTLRNTVKAGRGA
jgi:2-keto-4-pentenoate hydratase/2-oxohepta-3-ene-1,7-dioic acid hydratase in catechol pathway